MRFSKQLFAQFIDFAFLTATFLLFALSVFVINFILYPTKPTENGITVKTEALPIEFVYDLHLNDTVYDTLTKKKLGYITDIQSITGENETQLILKINAGREPRSDSLRTKELWFRYSYQKEDSGV